VVNSALVSLEDTIVAISTASGPGAIAVVRLSGPQACRIVRAIFAPGPKKVSSDWLKTHSAVHGYLKHLTDDKKIDEVIVTPFLAPHSYTGEDLIEISCHGSQVVTRQILSSCTELGARLARAGEFTERAFLAGKLDLTQAEAVLDLIQAKTLRQSRQALSALAGDLGRRIREVRQKLMLLLATIVAGIDFPDEVDETPEQDVDRIVRECMELLKQLADTARLGKYLRDGLRLAIVGRPNVGKSSLLNQLLKVERAIVTDIPGTTRDSLEELIDINGVPVILIDTAGIRETKDRVETIGIQRTKQTIADSDLVLLIEDISIGWGKEEDNIVGLVGSKAWLHLRNKIDLGTQVDSKDIQFSNTPFKQILIAAKSGQGIDALCKAIELWATGDNASFDLGASLNVRQAELCNRAITALKLVGATLEKGMPQDCLATDLKLTIDCLGEMCGELVSEELIGQVFANFCIGK
jgi:tRNA modification GTPase